MLPLGKELQRRGNRVTLFALLDAKSKTLAAGLEFKEIGESEFPQGIMAELLTQLGKLSGREALQLPSLPSKKVRLFYCGMHQRQ